MGHSLRRVLGSSRAVLWSCVSLTACPADDIYIQSEGGFEESTSQVSSAQPVPQSTANDSSIVPDLPRACGPEYPPGELPTECPPVTPIDFETELCRGFTPAEALAALDGLEFELKWSGYPDSPVTQVRVEAQYVDGDVFEGPGGSAGAVGLGPWWECEDGVVMDVEATLTTDDGWLSCVIPMIIQGVPDEDLFMMARPAIDANDGTLAVQPLLVDGQPEMLSELWIVATTSPDAGLRIMANTVDGPRDVLLGHTYDW